MKATLQTSVLRDKVLRPLSKIVDDCILAVDSDCMDAIATVDSGAIILYVKYDIVSDIPSKCELNIKDLSKLSSIIGQIKGQTVEMDVEPHQLKYTSDEFKFKFHLTEPGIIRKPKLKRESLESIKFQTSALLDAKKFNEVLKASAFIKSDDVRLYFYTGDAEGATGVYCDITNRKIPNADSLTIKLSESYDGAPITTPLVCDIEYIRKMCIAKDADMHAYFNTERGFTIFDFIDEGGRIRYIHRTLVK